MSKSDPAAPPSRRSLLALDGLNFFLADVQTGVGPFLAIYLAGNNWNPQRIGLALTVGGIAGIATQTPLGALIDTTRRKRSVIAAGVLALCVGAAMIALFPGFWAVLIAQATIGGMSSVFVPAVAAISMGLVGAAAFDRRQGRNQTFNAAGNVVAACAMGAIGYFLSNRGIFYFVFLLAAPTLLMLRLIDPKEIDYDAARGAKPSTDKPEAGSVKKLLRDKRVSIFLVCCVMFHFANAAMLPLIGEIVSHGKQRTAMFFMGLCVVVTQLVVTMIASPSGYLAGKLGRKPLLIVAFGALPLRGVLYTLTRNEYLLVSVQVLDGIAAGIFGVVSTLVIADLTRGTGRFNLAQGAIATAVGIGASSSQFVAGAIAHNSGYKAAFVFLAGIAALGTAFFVLAMPESCQPPCRRTPRSAESEKML